MNKKQQALVAEWRDAKKQLDEMKLIEAELREKVVALFEEEATGTNRLQIANGWVLKMSRAQTRHVRATYEQVLEVKAKLRKAGLPQAFVDSVFPVKYSVAAQPLKSLTANQVSLVDSLCEFRLSAPQLSLEMPKG